MISLNCLRSHRSASILGGSLLLAGALSAQSLFVKPVKVFGDPNFIGTAANPLAFDSVGPNVVEGREMTQPLGIALDNSVSPPIVYISDSSNNRVLAYQYNTQLTAGSYADLILGQPDKFTTLPQGPGVGVYSTGLNGPTGLAVDSAGNLYVADTGNNRILRYPKPFSQPAGFQFPNMIIGQTSFSANGANTGGVTAGTMSLAGSRTGLAFDPAGNLWVTDTGNNRVLRFPVSVLTAGSNGPSANLAVPQATMVSSVAATQQTSLTGILEPIGVTFDPAGDMLVTDQLARVLVYPPGVSFSASATIILGIPSSSATTPVNNTALSGPVGVFANGTNIFVADSENHRIMVYPPVASISTTGSAGSPAAINVLGQPNLTSGTANAGNPEPSSSSLDFPGDVAGSGTELFVADSGNNRVIVFPLNAGGPSAIASRVVGQLDFPYRAPNLIEGKEFDFAGSISSVSGSAILDYSASPPHLYVADTANNRILGFNDFTHMQNGQVADIVIGQPDMYRMLINYPSNKLGQPNQQGLNGPTSIAVDSAGNLYVADTFNARVVRFPTPFNPPSGSTTLESADLVIGQPDFNTIVTDPTPQTLSAPLSLAFTQNGANASMTTGMLFVVDANQNRVLAFSKPFSNGMSASLALGQSSYFVTASASTSAGLSAPRAVAIDPQDRVLVADSGNNRVQVFDQAENLSIGAAAAFSLTGFTQPVAIGVASNGEFWVADDGSGVNHLLHFPSVEVLPTVNYASDASQQALSPRSAFVDQFNNLLVADGINRVVYFTPQVAAVNAANYIPGRALAPGTIAAVFPSIDTNIIANGTLANSVFPVPAVMDDTQVFVNGTAAPLFYVSPGQINFVLPIGLPQSGTANLQIARQSTGQIYGAAEIALAAASPGLFTSAGTGTGQVAALNADNSVNSSTNPIDRGQVIQLFGTGQGFVSNAPPDGSPGSGLIPTSATPLVLLGDVFVPSANIQYSGLAPSEVGVWQINVLIPTTTPPANSVAIQVFMASVPSGNPAAPAQVATTIAVK